MDHSVFLYYHEFLHGIRGHYGHNKKHLNFDISYQVISKGLVETDYNINMDSFYPDHFLSLSLFYILPHLRIYHWLIIGDIMKIISLVIHISALAIYNSPIVYIHDGPADITTLLRTVMPSEQHLDSDVTFQPINAILFYKYLLYKITYMGLI